MRKEKRGRKLQIESILFENRPNSREREIALNILLCGISSSSPDIALKKYLSREGDILFAGDKTYNLDLYDRILVVGAGKSGFFMARAIEDVLLDKITFGLVIVKYGYKGITKKIKLKEAGHPLPDENSVKYTEEILNILNETNEKDLIICLLSGGASALMAYPPGEILLSDKIKLTEELLKCGANINEINIIRKHISLVKGGRLGECSYPSDMISLILSDVVGSPLDVIASGMTAPDNSAFQDGLDIIYKYSLESKIPSSIIDYIKRGVSGEISETPRQNASFFHKINNIIIGSNKLATDAVMEKAGEYGFNVSLISNFIQGEAREVAKVFMAIAREIQVSGNPILPPACIIGSGETTVTVRGDGKGGRNQEFALASAICIKDWKNIIVLASGTDGTDGPTDASGGIIDEYTFTRANEKGLNIYDYLSRNDSYTLLKHTGDLIITGPTNTNVNDLIMVFVF